ncbi:hypothetical protein HY970_01550 [Candidatus Kaiserbacteria bacterium]|nr:hypothetical protein [Candidatus Kaiserbacteria bacterium]
MQTVIVESVFFTVVPLVLGGFLYLVYKKAQNHISADENRSPSTKFAKILFFVLTIPLALFLLMMFAVGVMTGLGNG